MLCPVQGGRCQRPSHWSRDPAQPSGELCLWCPAHVPDCPQTSFRHGQALQLGLLWPGMQITGAPACSTPAWPPGLPHLPHPTSPQEAHPLCLPCPFIADPTPDYPRGREEGNYPPAHPTPLVVIPRTGKHCSVVCDASSLGGGWQMI